MSDLSAQLSAFKSKIKNRPHIEVARKPVAPKPLLLTKKRNEQTETVSQKRSASDHYVVEKRQRFPVDEISGSHLSTQLHLAVEFIKQHDAPISVNKLRNYLSFDISKKLLPLLKENIDRIKYNADNDTLEYTSLHNIRSADSLLDFLRSQPTFKGTSVKELSDGWSGCLQAIKELEEKNQILVLRNKKENAPRLVWPNLGGRLGLIDEEFRTMWNNVRLPEPDGLYQALIDQGLKPTGADPMQIKQKPRQQEQKKKKTRRGKITNTHMKGILKDYSQLV